MVYIRVYIYVYISVQRNAALINSDLFKAKITFDLILTSVAALSVQSVALLCYQGYKRCTVCTIFNHCAFEATVNSIFLILCSAKARKKYETNSSSLLNPTGFLARTSQQCRVRSGKQSFFRTSSSQNRI